jgi:hypothetical protein
VKKFSIFNKALGGQLGEIRFDIRTNAQNGQQNVTVVPGTHNHHHSHSHAQVHHHHHHQQGHAHHHSEPGQNLGQVHNQAQLSNNRNPIPSNQNPQGNMAAGVNLFDMKLSDIIRDNYAHQFEGIIR